MALSEDINNMIPKTEIFLNLDIIGDGTSNFVFDRFFKLNSYKTTGDTNSKLGKDWLSLPAEPPSITSGLRK